jgi:small subunit ribosomal protein S16
MNFHGLKITVGNINTYPNKTIGAKYFMVVIRLSRSGSKKRPFYHLSVADERNPRDGRFIERVGFFNPVARGSEEALRVDAERVEYWMSKGAQPSARVAKLLKDNAKAQA